MTKYLSWSSIYEEMECGLQNSKVINWNITGVLYPLGQILLLEAGP